MSFKNLIILFFFFVIRIDSIFSQIPNKNHIILKNDTSINEITKSKTSKSIIFFCPTAFIDKSIFEIKASELLNNSKIRELTDLTIHFIYFKQDSKNNSKGVKYISKNEQDTIFIGQFECFFIGFDNLKLVRAKNKMKFNYDIVHSFINENIFKIPIIDTNKCFEKIPDRIPFYADFIKESIQPSFSLDERIKVIEDSLNQLNSYIENVIKQNQYLVKQNQELIEIIKTQNKPKRRKIFESKLDIIQPENKDE